MKFGPALVGAMLVVSAVFFATPASAGGLTFDSETWNVGNVSTTEKLEHVFRFRNNGSRTVVIKDVKTSCGCTAAVLSGRRLYRPGESGGITVTVDPATSHGPLSTAVKVWTNLSNDPLNLYIKGRVTYLPPKMPVVNLPAPIVSVTPEHIDFGTVKPGQAITYRIVVGNDGAGELFITNFNAPNEDSGMPLSRKPIAKGKKIELTGIYNVPKSSGPLEDFLLIKTNDPARPVIKVRMTGNVR